MFAVLRKNVGSLISSHSSFVRKSHVSFSLSLQSFSTSRERILVRSPRVVYDLLVNKHQFSPQVASVVASALSRCRSPEKADSTLSFLKESGFSITQLEKIAKYRPSILAAGSEDDIKFKIKIFQDLGLPPEGIAKLLSSQASILNLSAKNNIIPSLSVLKDLLGSNHEVATLLTRCAWFLQSDLKKTLVPNVELLKSCSICMKRIRTLIYRNPRCLLFKPDILRKSVDKAEEMGLSRSSKMFIHYVRMIACTYEGTWEVKFQAFRNLGFSDSDVLTMFRQAPLVFGVSIKKMEKVKELLLATGKFSTSSIVGHPESLMCSTEKRLKPRLQILGILERKNLIKKWPGLGLIRSLTDDKFYERFISPYSNELAEEYVTKSYIKGKR